MLQVAGWIFFLFPYSGVVEKMAFLCKKQLINFRERLQKILHQSRAVEPCGDSSIDDENRCRKGLKCTEIKGFRGLPQKPAAVRNPFHSFSISILYTESAEMRRYRLDNCVARLQVTYSAVFPEGMVHPKRRNTVSRLSAGSFQRSPFTMTRSRSSSKRDFR